jgi:hypothetical protein
MRSEQLYYQNMKHLGKLNSASTFKASKLQLLTTPSVFKLHRDLHERTCSQALIHPTVPGCQFIECLSYLLIHPSLLSCYGSTRLSLVPLVSIYLKDGENFRNINQSIQLLHWF